MLIRSFFQEKLQLNHGKHKQLTPQVLFATLTHDDQIKFKPAHCLVKHETALPSLKDGCHPGPAHIGKDRFLIGNDNEGEIIVIKTLDSFSFDAVQLIQVPFKKPIMNSVRTLIQQFSSDTDNEDPVGRREPQDKIPYQTDLFSVHKFD